MTVPPSQGADPLQSRYTMYACHALTGSSGAPTHSFVQATLVRHCSPQLDMRFDEGQGTMTGWFVGKSAGGPRGFWGDGNCHALEVWCNEGDVGLGVGGGGCDEGDCKEG